MATLSARLDVLETQSAQQRAPQVSTSDTTREYRQLELQPGLQISQDMADINIEVPATPQSPPYFQ